MPIRSDEGITTLADRWEDRLATVPIWNPPAVATVVVVPHPDDEVLSCAGLIGRQRSRGARVLVLAVTDGEHAYDLPSAEDRARLGRVRRGEQLRALRILGLGDDDVVHLELGDGSVEHHEEELAAIIARAAEGYELIVSPWTHDHHGDHEACGRAARAAASALGVASVHGLFWTWHHSEASSLDAEEVVGLSLSLDELCGRAAALAQHRTQLTDVVSPVPMLSSAELEPISWPFEYYIRGPR